MLQRMQSLWLLLASAFAILSFQFPFYSGTNKDGVASFKLFPDTHHFMLLLFTILVAVVSLLSIFLFKNRTLQLRFTLLALLLEIILLALYFKEASSFVSGTGTIALTSLLQLFIVVFLLLAVKGIRHDNKIIRDSERLR
ncbi:MAG: DUF4293 domain-containing protein [Sphingobacteriales bacterium]|jgi:hypothetical protein|nr:DUF4293 domain-containing protein [Sphingobacteriales bacterium]